MTERTAGRVKAKEMVVQARMQEQLNLYREIVNHSSDAIAIIDPLGCYLEQNDAHRALVGYSDDELRGKTPAIHFGEQAFSEIARALQETGRFRGELVSHTRSGEAVDIELAAFAVRDADGRPVCYVGIKRDIRDRKRGEAALRRSQDELYQREQDFRALAENAPDVIARFDAELRHRYVNPAVERATGIPASRFIGKTNEELGLPTELAAAWRKELSAVFRTGKEALMEFSFPSPRGSIHYQSRIVPEFAKDGSVESVLGITRDITESKQVQEKLRFLSKAGDALASSLEYESALGNVAQLLVPRLADWCTVNIMGEREEVRRVASACADPDKVELLRELGMRYPPTRRAPHPAQRVLASGQPEFAPEVTGEWLASHTRDAEHARLVAALGYRSYMCVPLRARGRLLGALSLVMAESGRRYSEDDLALAQELARRCGLAVDNARLYHHAQAAIELRDEFFSVAAHELKTPVAGLRGMAQLLNRRLRRQGGIDAEQLAGALETIDVQSEKLARLTNQLLDVSRLQQGRLVLDRRETELPGIINAAVSTARLRTSEHRIEARVPEHLTASVDALRLEQVLTNLLDNAIKFSPPGASVEVELRQRSPDEVEIVVRDRGAGIPEGQRESLFQPFQQAHPPAHLKGMGLGLYITRQIVEAHGGTIGLDSQEGRGTAVTVRLPIE